MEDQTVKKEFLLTYRKSKMEEELYLQEAEAVLGCKIFRSNALTGMPASHNQTDLSNLSVTVEEMYQKYMGLRYESAMAAAKVFEAINALPDVVERKVLIERYIKYHSNYKLKNWEEISEIMGYSRSRIIDYHLTALKKLHIF